MLIPQNNKYINIYHNHPTPSLIDKNKEILIYAALGTEFNNNPILFELIINTLIQLNSKLNIKKQNVNKVTSFTGRWR